MENCAPPVKAVVSGVWSFTAGLDNGEGSEGENGNEDEDGTLPPSSPSYSPDHCFVTYNGSASLAGYLTPGCPVHVVLPPEVNGETVTQIAEYGFADSGLVSFVIPDSVHTIGADAFAVNVLGSVIIGNGARTIGDYAFVANNLTEVYIPDSVEVIGAGAFLNNPITTASVPRGADVATDAFPASTVIEWRD